MQIHHRNGSYDVRFESLRNCFDALPDDLRLITDSTVYGHFEEQLKKIPHVKVVEPGETSKSLEVYGPLLSWMAQSKASRRTTVCAFGGGVIGDLAGFVAASYMRGVPLYQIPTTLLSQVDSSVGGKVGVDLPEGKNLAGAFYPPAGVSIAVEMLRSLPDKQFRNGMAEVWKYGFIMDTRLIDTLAGDRLDPTHHNLESVVERCIRLKSQVVEADEFETLGIRAILNYGHTVGHAIEYLVGYGKILHGEAISIGMVVEARLGEVLGITRIGVRQEVEQFLSWQGLPTTHSALADPDGLVAAMYGDKKAIGTKLGFSLLTDLGQCKLVEGVPENTVRAALRAS